jgi:molybdopterin converting factor small subunit
LVCIHWVFSHAITFAGPSPCAAAALKDNREKEMQVEFLGVSRQRAGIAELAVEATTLGELLLTLSDRLPSLSDVIVGNRLHPAFVANLNGDEFICDPDTKLNATDSVLILSADAGG